MLDELSRQSWTVQNDWLSATESEALRDWAERQRAQGRFRPAGIGTDGGQRPDIRSDEILWWPHAPEPALEAVQNRVQSLQKILNQELYLGLNESELHFAVYPPGHFYGAHRDQRATGHGLSGERVISFVLYLNPDWRPEDQGELVIFESENPSRVAQQILPHAGRLVLFRSDLILHEVLAPRRERWSLTGWFRRR